VKVALVCPTVGQTRRGYERFITDLFALVRSDVDITLFKGGGKPAPGEVVVPHMTRTGMIARLAGGRASYTRSRLEFATFAIALWPHLARGKFDVVHSIDPPLAKKLSTLRRLTRSRYRLVFTEGGPDPFDATPYADHIHYVTPAARDAALAAGAPAERTSVLPVGVDTGRMAGVRDRDALRRELGVAPGTFVILAVTTLNRHHKRVHHLIDEIARLPGDILLWIDASVHPDGDASLVELARERLGTRFRHTHVASDRVVELYRLADVLVSASLHESYGMAIVEAMCAGLPVLVHDSPHFRWLVDGPGQRVDMAQPGALAARLAYLMDHRDELRDLADGERAMRRFGWEAQKEGYLELYRRASRAEAHASP
jgi:glycosyltransferase involved in cell wall biosynthesis